MAQPQKTIWQKTKTNSKAGFDKLWGYADKLGAPVNRLSNKLGSEAFWPTTLDKEADKAARILRSFCKDGFYQEQEYQSPEGPKKKQKVLKKIPTEVIRKAKGLAIFTTMRSGLWISGAGGSGVLVARMEDGSWSPPSGILLHTAGLGFLVGVDIYDCVLVLNTQKALDSFSKLRCTVGGEISAVAGPVGMGGVLDSEVHTRQAPIFTYLKSRGFYAGVQVDGTIVVERTDENERFYKNRIPVGDILTGKVKHPPYELRTLMETLKAAQGDTNLDETALSSEPPPADYEIEEDEPLFGVPDKEDPDPYGVLALEKEGLQIKEAGTHKRATSEQFEFKPSITSPVYSKYNRKSSDSPTSRNSWRTSTFSNLDRRHSMTDSATQTDLDPPSTPPTPSRKGIQLDDNDTDTMGHDQTQTDSDAVGSLAKTQNQEDGLNSSRTNNRDVTAQDSDNVDEEPVVHEVQQAAAPQMIMRPRIVTVQKRIPPKLPPRNPQRMITPTTPVTEKQFQDASIGTDQKAELNRPSTPSSPAKESSAPSAPSGSSFDEQEKEESVTSKASSPRRSGSFQSVRSVTSQKEKKDVPGGFPEHESMEDEESTPPHQAQHDGTDERETPKFNMSSIRQSLNREEESRSRSPSPQSSAHTQDDFS